MEILLVRHAIAEPRAAGLADEERRLTAKGERRFRDVVRGLVALDHEVERVYTSPWRRARQTAELLAAPMKAKLVTLDALAAPPSAASLEGLVGNRVALVGHEPWMGMLLSLLLFGTTEHGDRFPFKKGGVAHVFGAAKPAGMCLRALHPPKTLRHIAPAAGPESDAEGA